MRIVVVRSAGAYALPTERRRTSPTSGLDREGCNIGVTGPGAITGTLIDSTSDRR